MTKKSDTTFVTVMHPVCCGPDIHKSIISACLITLTPPGVPQYEMREFSTFTDSLFLLRDWPAGNNWPYLKNYILKKLPRFHYFRVEEKMAMRTRYKHDRPVSCTTNCQLFKETTNIKLYFSGPAIFQGSAEFFE